MTYDFGYEPQVWYYDGARVFFQIADYTGDRNWEACAFNVARQYRDFVISNNGRIPGWRIFSRGLRMAYERSGDATYRQAVRLLSTNAGVATWTPAVTDLAIREMAYIAEAHIDAEKMGDARSPHLARTIDYLLGHYDMLFVSGTYHVHQTFFDGLAAEALIAYYELTGDTRMPPAVKMMLDWLWDYGWNKSTHQMVYNPDPYGPKCGELCQEYLTNLIHLVVPAFGWYWNISGNAIYQQRGDEMFSHALDDGIWSGKMFSQNYRWSGSYVQWRSATTSSNTNNNLPAPAAPAPVAPAPVAPVCTYAVSATSTLSLPSTGGAATLAVTTGSGCSWTASSNVAWAVPSIAGGTGTTVITFNVAANSAAARTGTLTVGDQNFTLSQAAAACAYTVSVAGGSTSSSSSGRSIDVPLNVYGSAPGLGYGAPSTPLRIETEFHNWTPNGGNSFTTVGMPGFTLRWRSGQSTLACESPYDGGPNGSSLSVPVAERQDFVVRCQRDISGNRLTAEIWNADGSGYASYVLPMNYWSPTLNLSAIALGRLNYEQANVAFRMAFLRISNTVKPLGAASPKSVSETGNIANYEFENNTNDSSGSNRHFVMNTTPSYYDTAVTASSDSSSVAPSGGSLAVQVACQSYCSWTANSTAPWAMVTAGASGTGNGTVTVAFAANTSSAARTAALNVAGQVVSITQAAAAATCTPAVTGRSIDVPLNVYGLAVTGLGYGASSTPLRLEARFQNWTPNAGNSFSTAGMPGFGIRWIAGTTNFFCETPYDSGPNGGALGIPVAGRTDFTVRCQRDVANNQLTGEVWNADGSGYAMYRNPITRWSSTLNLAYIALGRLGYETANVSFRMAFLRISNTVKALGAASPNSTAETGNLANYEFEDNANDTSGNNRHLIMNTAPAFYNTDGSGGGCSAQ